MSAHVKIIISFTMEFLNFRHWSRNTKFCGKSWELHYYQTSYWGFCGKHSHCGILMRALKQIYPKSIKAFRASSSLCLPYRDTDRGISTQWISYLYIVHSFKGSSMGQPFIVCSAGHLPALFHQASQLMACRANGEKSEGWTWLQTGTENKSKCSHILKNYILRIYSNQEFKWHMQ